MATAHVNGIDIEHEEMGNRADPAMLLIMGLSAQMIWWDDEFCSALADRGHRVIRFDNRDVGLSTKITGGPPFDLAKAMSGDRSAAAYTLDDMAQDSAGLLDALDVDRAHVVGASMGGMIAQALAIHHPDRVASVCSIMSTTGARDVGQPSQEAMTVLLRPPAATKEEYLEGSLAAAKVIGSPGFPFHEDRIRARAERSWERGYYPEGVGRQLAAILVSPDRTPALASVTAPTLVVHGDADPLVSPSGGEATAKAVPGAELLMVPGMGHDLPPEAWPTVVDAIVANASRAGR